MVAPVLSSTPRQPTAPQGGEDLAEAIFGVAVFAGIGTHRDAAVASWQQAARHVFEIDQADALTGPVGGELVGLMPHSLPV